MLFAFWLLLLLLAGSAALPLLDFPAAQGLMMMWTAVSAAVAGLAMRRGEAAHLVRTFRYFVVIAAVPAVWMLVQVLPAPGFANPIWASAEEALEAPLVGHISIDIGETLRGLCVYLLAVGAAVTTSVVCIDRVRAERTLFVLGIVTAVMAITIIIHDLAGLTFLGEIEQDARITFDTAATLGVVLAPAMGQLALERYEARGTRTRMAGARLTEGLSIALASFLLCGFSVHYFSREVVPVAASAGLAAYLVTLVIRRLALGPWLGTLFAGAVLAAAAILAVNALASRAGDLTLRLASVSPSERAGVERMIADRGAMGSGAGSYPALRTLYLDTQDRAERPAPTAAARLTIEFGRPGLWVFLALALGVAAVLLGGALRRGRDSFYAASGASCVITAIVLAFRHAGVLEPTSAILIAAVVGLGLAQSASRPVA